MKRILFVDDDQDLLDGLRSRLHKRRNDWDMVFVTSGLAAIEELSIKTADLVVTDVRMPGMDGGQLLMALKSRWPATIRIVMSGYTEPDKMLQLIALTHRYVSKPCDAAQLENIIERCLRLDDLLHNSKLKALVGRIGKLPALPKTCSRLQAALSQPNVQAALLADIIMSDAVITAKVLQVVNSAFFRLARPVGNIKQAVNYLGFSTIRNLVMSAEVFSQWEKIKVVPGLEPERLQANAERHAAACMALAAGSPLVDDALLVGLLHDIGYWILLQECPDELLAALKHADTAHIPSAQAEREIIGTSHADIGAYLLGLWGFPYQIVEAVAYHHEPLVVPSQSFDLLAMLSVAHSLLPGDDADALLLSSECTPSVDADYFQKLNPPYSWQEAAQRVANSRIVE